MSTSMVSALRQWVRFILTPTGAILVLGTAAALWAVLGLPGPRAAAVVAILLTAAFLVQKFSALTAQNRRLSERISALRPKLEKIDKLAASQKKAYERSTRRYEANKRRIDRANTLIRETGAVLRAEIAGSQLDERDWDSVEVEDVPDPVLSIAIPGYNRPEALWQCLESLIEQIEPEHTNRVEVIITDDRSTDRRATEVAHAFAKDHNYIGFRRNETNLGLERNLIECAKPCRGRYLWVFGNDDLLGPEALDKVLGDLDTDRFDILVYNKERMTKYGAEEAFRPGNQPIDIPVDELYVFDSMLEVGTQTGLISTFGWITQVLRRRVPCMDIDPEPFYDTSLHPHLGMLMVAYPDSPVAFRNTNAVIHRTQDPRERLAEGAGRPEVAYMAGGMERNSRWFGAGYAAMLQRVIDRSDLVAEDLLGQMEALWTELSLLDWIHENWQWGLENGTEIPGDALEDATRLFDSLGREVPSLPIESATSGSTTS